MIIFFLFMLFLWVKKLMQMGTFCWDKNVSFFFINFLYWCQVEMNIIYIKTFMFNLFFNYWKVDIIYICIYFPDQKNVCKFFNKKYFFKICYKNKVLLIKIIFKNHKHKKRFNNILSFQTNIGSRKYQIAVSENYSQILVFRKYFQTNFMFFFLYGDDL